MTVPGDDLAVRLGAWLERVLGLPGCRIVELRRHAEGFSWETFTVTAAWESAGGTTEQRGFAVRREPADGLLAPYDAAQQYAVHVAVASHSAVPMPAPIGLEQDAAVLDRPFYVVERVEGHVPVQWQPDDPVAFPSEQARHALGLEFVDVLARIHAIDWRSAGLGGVLEAPATSDDAARREILRWERRYEADMLREVPLLRAALAWLRANVTTSGRVALVHGDYRIGNFMTRDGHVVAVFDWELAHLSDPVEDIAYSGLPLFRGRSPRFSHLLPPDVYLDRYRERTGLDVGCDALRFWTVLGLVKAAVPHLSAARAFEDGRADDVRLAAMGHQVLHVLRHLATELELEVP